MMNATEMIFKLPQFEMKDFSDTDWKKVPEKYFLANLSDSAACITPVLRQMFQGKEITAQNRIYRIKF